MVNSEWCEYVAVSGSTDAVSKMRTVMSYDDDAMSERACGDQRSFLTA